MGNSEGNQLEKAMAARQPHAPLASDFVAVVSNPELKLLEQVREVLRAG